MRIGFPILDGLHGNKEEYRTGIFHLLPHQRTEDVDRSVFNSMVIIHVVLMIIDPKCHPTLHEEARCIHNIHVTHNTRHYPTKLKPISMAHPMQI